ncbi:MAG: RHS repeat domain-containing protein [Eubacteriales bacterium]|nr:RHS repeat domain-containing protein [Eubacteriales bacterium]
MWFDAQKRTTKTVDANGGEISYTYDQNSNIIAITDALGNTRNTGGRYCVF